MPRVSDFVEAPYQGVSQAASQVRLATQAEVLEDILVSIPQGAQPRPPFEFGAVLEGVFPQVNMAHAYFRSGGDKYLLTLSNDAGVVTPSLYNIDGLPISYSATGLAPETLTVTPEAQAYLNLLNPVPNQDFRTLSVEDTTFILNRNVVIANEEASPGVPLKSAPRDFEAMVWVRSAAYAREYTVVVTPETGTPVTATLRTPNGQDSSDGDWVDTKRIASSLLSGSYTAVNGASISGNLNALTAQGFTVSRVSGVINISHPTVDFTVTVEDGQGGTGLLAIKDSVQAFSSLPQKAPPGFKVKIRQQSGSDEDDFFVEFEETAGPGSGIWTETLAAEAELGVDPATLPIGLVQVSGVWTLKQLEWGQRTVGDEELSPDPGFVGYTIEDISFHRGRLFLTYAEGTAASSADDPLKFYPTTLSSVLTSDTFERINPFNQNANFKYAVPFKSKLVLWGSTGQAQITSQGPLAPDTARIDQFSAYEFSEEAPPQGSNDRLYFVADKGSTSSAVYEMEIAAGSTETVEGDDMTVSVPRFLPAHIDRVASSPVNYLMTYGVSGASSIVVHLFRYSDRQRIQNAWFKWNLPRDCRYLGGWFVNTTFYVLLLRNGETILSFMDISPGIVDDHIDSRYLTAIDLRVKEVDLVRTYSEATGNTTISLPYIPTPDLLDIETSVRSPGGIGGPILEGDAPLPAYEGILPQIVSVSGNDIILLGDWTQAPLWMGESYLPQWNLSTIFVRDDNGSPRRTGNFVLKKITLDLEETAYLRVRVRVGARRERVYTFESSLLDTPDKDFDRVNLYSGPWAFPVQGITEDCDITIESDTAFPFTILGYTWEGEINPKASRGSGSR